MLISRRNALVVMLVLVAAGGVVGTGAFSTVTADRTVDINTAGDANANVQFQVNTGYDSLSDGGSDDVIGLTFDNINLDANTTYDNAMNVTVNDASADGTFTIEVTETPDNLVVEFEDGGGTEVTGVEPGKVKEIDMTIDTRTVTDTDTTVGDGDIEFEVTRTSATP